MTPKFTEGPWNRVKPWLSEYWTLGVIRNHAAIPLESEDDWILAEAAPELYEAAQNTVTYYAATAPGRTCLNDELNPCLGLRHWGGGVGCPLCSARAALAKAEGKP